MPVDDLWFLKKRGPDGQRLRAKRHGRGMRYRVRYVDDTGEKTTKFFDRKLDAADFDASVRVDVLRGNYIDPTEGAVPVREFGEKWRMAQLHRDSTASLVERSLRLHIYPVIGSKPLASVRRTHIQALIKGLDVGPSTVRVIHQHLVSLFNAAVLDKAIAASPCVGITLPELPHSEHLILTPKQVHAIATALRGDLRASVYVGAGCGLRPSEMLGLEVGNVDFLRREISVVQQLRTTTGRAPFLAPVKTKTSRRVVELPKITVDALARHMERFPPAEAEVVDETDPRKPVTRTAKLLFTDGGTPITRSVWGKAWWPAARAADLPVHTGYHALRHYFASLLIFAGASVKTVQMALGHSTPTITLNTYVGLWPDQVDRTRNLVDAALGAMPGLAVAR